MRVYKSLRRVGEGENRWEALANAIIEQAVDDYLASDESAEEAFKRFLYSDYFKILTNISPNYLYEKVRELKYEKSNPNTRR